MACVKELGQGNFDAELERFPGKKAFINDTIEIVRENLKSVSVEINSLVSSAIEGKLKERIDETIFDGDWRRMSASINKLLGAVVEPVDEAAIVLSEMATGNFGARVTGNYQGDHAQIKNALNTTLDSIQEIIQDVDDNLSRMANKDFNLDITKEYIGDWDAIRKSFVMIIESMNSVLTDINLAAEEVTVGSNQVSESAQTLSQGASEQAASIEQITASMQQVGEQTRVNAENAAKANDISEDS